MRRQLLQRRKQTGVHKQNLVVGVLHSTVVDLPASIMMRTAAYVLAVDKVAQATTIRGIYP